MDLSSRQICEIISKIPKFNKHFFGVFPCNRLPKFKLLKPTGIIINVDESYKPGSHWIAIYLPKQGNAVYFDSFGQPPTGLIQSFLEEQVKNQWLYSRKKLQSDFSVSCGHFCIVFLYFALMADHNQFFDLLKNCKERKNEEFISVFMFLFK